jgi:hypothetical protein
MSYSPVIEAVITGLLAVALAAISSLSGLSITDAEKRDQENASHPAIAQVRRAARPISLWPVTVLIFGVVVGSVGGVRIRNADLLGLNPTEVIAKWTTGTGLEKSKVADQLLRHYYPVPGKAESSPEAPSTPKTPLPVRGGLYASVTDATFCATVDGNRNDGTSLRFQLQRYPDDRVQRFVEHCKDDQLLKDAYELLICPK